MSATDHRARLLGEAAEQRVEEVLKSLPPPWQTYPTLEWRRLGRHGEEVGEADIVVFHPKHGLIVFEIKAGAVTLKEGQWFYASGRPMKQSPFSQARRNRFALAEKLERRLGRSVMETLTLTHAVWFPDVAWPKGITILEAPSAAFILDRSALADPEPALLRILGEAGNQVQPLNRARQNAVRELLAPDCQLLTPLSFRLDDTLLELHRATDQQMTVLRLLRTQKRLLVEGGAGSGKTLLAVTLARDHALNGKRVLFTCFNKALAQQLAAQLTDYPGITVLHFHELVRQQAASAGLPYVVPAEITAQSRFFNEDCAELLLQAAEAGSTRYDTLIVDEAADFAPTWWLALEALGAKGFAWYCFFDRHQSLYQEWSPPFAGEVLPLDINLRNTRPVGDLATRLGRCPAPLAYRVEQVPEPQIRVCEDFKTMAEDLRHCLRQLIREEGVAPERIAVLSPWRHTNARSEWAAGLDEVKVNSEPGRPEEGSVSVGTVHAFKGLESDVVVLVGLTPQALTHRELLYVGTSRARVALYVLSLVAV